MPEYTEYEKDEKTKEEFQDEAAMGEPGVTLEALHEQVVAMQDALPSMISDAIERALGGQAEAMAEEPAPEGEPMPEEEFEDDAEVIEEEAEEFEDDAEVEDDEEEKKAAQFSRRAASRIRKLERTVGKLSKEIRVANAIHAETFARHREHDVRAKLESLMAAGRWNSEITDATVREVAGMPEKARKILFSRLEEIPVDRTAVSFSRAKTEPVDISNPIAKMFGVTKKTVEVNRSPDVLIKPRG